MATKILPILGPATKPDASGDVFFEPYSVKATNDVFDQLVLIFNDTAAKDSIYGLFRIPQDYVDTAKILVEWSSTATAGDVEWDFDYRAVAAGESMDQASVQESVNQNDTAPGSTDLRLTAELSLTDGNFAAGDLVPFFLSRDGTDGGDTMSAAAMVFGVYFSYADA